MWFSKFFSVCIFFLIIIFLCSFAVFQPLSPAPYNCLPCLWIHGPPTGNRPFHGFVHLLTWSEGKFVDFAGKGTFKLVRLLSLKRFVENYKRYSSSKSWNFYRCLYGRELNVAPPKLASLLILKCFFQWCQWIFLNLSMSKAEKTSGHVYSQTSTNSHPSTLGTSLQQPLFLSRRDNDSCLKGLCHGSPVHFV